MCKNSDMKQEKILSNSRELLIKFDKYQMSGIKAEI